MGFGLGGRALDSATRSIREYRRGYLVGHDPRRRHDLPRLLSDDGADATSIASGSPWPTHEALDRTRALFLPRRASSTSTRPFTAATDGAARDGGDPHRPPRDAVESDRSSSSMTPALRPTDAGTRGSLRESSMPRGPARGVSCGSRTRIPDVLRLIARCARRLIEIPHVSRAGRGRTASSLFVSRGGLPLASASSASPSQRSAASSTSTGTAVKTRLRPSRRQSIDDLGVEIDMIDITTGTGDFIANGVISHNCFARGTHEYLEFDAGRDFDSQIVVKINVAEVLRRELARGTWQREPVALGTNTDPYQRAEGRYRLMPGIIVGPHRLGHAVLDPDEGHAAAARPSAAAGGRGIRAASRSRCRSRCSTTTLQKSIEPGTPDDGGAARDRARGDRGRVPRHGVPDADPPAPDRLDRGDRRRAAAHQRRRARRGSSTARCTCGRASSRGSCSGSSASIPNSSRPIWACTRARRATRPRAYRVVARQARAPAAARARPGRTGRGRLAAAGCGARACRAEHGCHDVTRARGGTGAGDALLIGAAAASDAARSQVDLRGTDRTIPENRPCKRVVDLWMRGGVRPGGRAGQADRVELTARELLDEVVADADLVERRLDLGALEQLVHAAATLARHDRHDAAARTRTARAARAVEVRLVLVRRVGLDDERDVIDVDAARRDVRRHEHPHPTRRSAAPGCACAWPG